MPLTRLLIALVTALGLIATTAPPSAVAGSSEYGRAWRKDGVLRAGCHDYRFHYRVRPGNVQPGNDWSAELFLVDPRGEGLATVIKDSEIDPKRGRGTYQICRYTTEFGRFKIRGKLSVFNGTEPVQKVWIKPGYFRLRRP